MRICVGGMSSKQKLKNSETKFDECSECHFPLITKTGKYMSKVNFLIKLGLEKWKINSEVYLFGLWSYL